MGRVSVSHRTAVHQVLPVPVGMTAKFNGRIPRGEVPDDNNSREIDIQYTVPVVGYAVIDRITIREAEGKVLSEIKDRCVEPLVVLDWEFFSSSTDGRPLDRGGIMPLSDWDWEWSKSGEERVGDPLLIWFTGLELNGLPFGPVRKALSEFAKREDEIMNHSYDPDDPAETSSADDA